MDPNFRVAHILADQAVALCSDGALSWLQGRALFDAVARCAGTLDDTDRTALSTATNLAMSPQMGTNTTHSPCSIVLQFVALVHGEGTTLPDDLRTKLAQAPLPQAVGYQISVVRALLEQFRPENRSNEPDFDDNMLAAILTQLQTIPPTFHDDPRVEALVTRWRSLGGEGTVLRSEISRTSTIPRLFSGGIRACEELLAKVEQFEGEELPEPLCWQLRLVRVMQKGWPDYLAAEPRVKDIRDRYLAACVRWGQRGGD